MDTKEIFQSFLEDVKKSFPDVSVADINIDETVSYIESEFHPSIVKILQRDETFFTEKDRILFGINFSEIWRTDESKRETLWKHIILASFMSFLHGDIKEKLGNILTGLKSLWSSSGQSNDDIDKILNDEHAEDHFREILDYLTNCRLAKVFTQIAEEIDLNELQLNFENPQELLEMVKNPDHPTMKRVISKIQHVIQSKVERGEITQQQLVSEIEAIKAKVTSLFGNVFNDAIGGRRSDLPSSVLMGNSPEARRQRMLARLQKKQRDRK